MILGAIGEVRAFHIPFKDLLLTSHQWILGNTFPCVVFGSFGSFWIALGITLMPYTGAFGDYSTNPNNPALGLESVGFNVGWGMTIKSLF